MKSFVESYRVVLSLKYVSSPNSIIPLELLPLEIMVMAQAGGTQPSTF